METWSNSQKIKGDAQATKLGIHKNLLNLLSIYWIVVGKIPIKQSNK